jgi:phosphotransferase system HPr (HPr) family protein
MKEKTRINLFPSELKAIQDHKYYLSQRLGREASIDEAIQDFLDCYKEVWMREQQKRDNTDQVREIEKLKWIESERAGKDIGEIEAVRIFSERYASIWRKERESLVRHGFHQISTAVRNEKGLHVRPTSRLVSLTGRYDCDVYVHMERMDYYNFKLNGKPYMHVRSVLGLLSLGIVKGDVLEFIASGKESEAALRAIADFLDATESC